MRILVHIFVCLIAVSASAQDASVIKRVFASPGPNFFYVEPSLALNEKNRVTQVVWERHPGNHPGHSTLIRKINAAGAQKGSPRTIINGTNPYDPTLLYNRNKNEFAIVFADEFQNPVHTIFIQRLDAKGRLKGAPVQISTDSGQSFVNQHAVAAFDPSTNRYVILWARNSTTSGTSPGEGIYAAVLDANFVTLAGPALIRSENAAFGTNPQVHDMQVLLSGKVVVSFTETAGINPVRNTYYVAAFDLDLNNRKVKKLTRAAVATDRPDAIFASFPSSTLVYFVDSNKIRKRKIDDLGRPIGVISNAFGAPLASKELFVPRFAQTPQSTGTKGLLVAIEDPSQTLGNGKIWIQRVDPAGKPVGNPEEVDSGFLTASDLDIVTLPTSTSTQLKFSAIYVNGGQITIPPQGEFSELIHLNLTVPLD